MTLHLVTPTVRLVEQYRTARFVLLPKLLTSDNVATLLAVTYDMPVGKVTCNSGDNHFGEQNFDSTHPAYQLFERSELIDLVRSLTGLRTIEQLVCWTSVYDAGQFINPHRDGAGTIQLLVCLQTTVGPQNGGELIVDGSRLFLTLGDAIAFEATSLEHYTTPLVASGDDPHPQRKVLVGRYFLKD